MDQDVTIFESIKFPLFLQRIIALSPFIQHGTELLSSWWSTIYSYVFLLSYLVTMLFSLYCLNAQNYEWVERSGGYLWTIIVYFEILFSNIAYTVMLIALERNKNQQIWFLNQIHEWDELCRVEFQIAFTNSYNRLRIRQYIELSLCVLYYGLIFLIIHIKLYSLDVYSVGVILFTVTYMTEQFSSGLMTWTVFNSVRLLYSKFHLLQEMQQNQFTTVHKHNLSLCKRKQLIIFKAFKKLCNAIDVLSREMGSIVIVRCAHDFTLATSQCYMIYWILLDNTGDEKYEFVLSVALWMAQNFFKMGGIAMVCHKTINEVGSLKTFKLRKLK